MFPRRKLCHVKYLEAATMERHSCFDIDIRWCRHQHVGPEGYVCRWHNALIISSACFWHAVQAWQATPFETRNRGDIQICLLCINGRKQTSGISDVQHDACSWWRMAKAPAVLPWVQEVGKLEMWVMHPFGTAMLVHLKPLMVSIIKHHVVPHASGPSFGFQLTCTFKRYTLRYHFPVFWSVCISNTSGSKVPCLACQVSKHMLTHRTCCPVLWDMVTRSHFLQSEFTCVLLPPTL